MKDRAEGNNDIFIVADMNSRPLIIFASHYPSAVMNEAFSVPSACISSAASHLIHSALSQWVHKQQRTNAVPFEGSDLNILFAHRSGITVCYKCICFVKKQHSWAQNQSSAILTIHNYRSDSSWFFLNCAASIWIGEKKEKKIIKRNPFKLIGLQCKNGK